MMIDLAMWLIRDPAVQVVLCGFVVGIAALALCCLGLRDVLLAADG